MQDYNKIEYRHVTIEQCRMGHSLVYQVKINDEVEYFDCIEEAIEYIDSNVSTSQGIKQGI